MTAPGRPDRVAQIPPDIAWIEPRFAIGSRPFAAQRAVIRALGVDTVITLHGADAAEVQDWGALGVELVQLPTRDLVAIPASCFSELVQLVLDRLKSGRTVLLHCLAGINRAPTLAAAVLCYRDRVTVEQAIAQVCAVRPSASPTHEQLASLHAWLERQRQRTRER